MLSCCAAGTFTALRSVLVRTASIATCRLDDLSAAYTAQQKQIVSSRPKFNKGGDRKSDHGDRSQNGASWRRGGRLMLAGVFLLPLSKDEDQAKVELSKKEKEVLVKKADQLHDDYEYDEEYELLMKVAVTKDPDILWRAARVSIMRRDSIDVMSPDVFQKLTMQAFDLATKGRDLGPNHALCLLWYGITLNHMQVYRSTKQQIDDVYMMNQMFKRAVELNPKHAYSWHCLGQWHFHVADTSWLKWQAVRVMYRDLPKSTYEEALMCFNQAEILEPGFYSGNLWLLAQCYMRMKQKDKVYTLLWKIINYPAATEEDKSFRDKAKYWLKLDFNENIHDDYEDPKEFAAAVSLGFVAPHDDEQKEKMRLSENEQRKKVNERERARKA